MKKGIAFFMTFIICGLFSVSIAQNEEVGKVYLYYSNSFGAGDYNKGDATTYPTPRIGLSIGGF